MPKCPICGSSEVVSAKHRGHDILKDKSTNSKHECTIKSFMKGEENQNPDAYMKLIRKKWSR